MNMFNNSKQCYLTACLCFAMASFGAVPLAAQKKPADVPLTVEAPATGEVAWPSLVEANELAVSELQSIFLD